MSVSHPIHLTCREVVELVTEFLDDAMAADDRIRVEQHLLVCPPCTSHIGQMRATIARLGELGEPPDSGSSSPVREAALDVFRRWKAP